MEIICAAAERDDQGIVSNRADGRFDAAIHEIDGANRAAQKAEAAVAAHVANGLRDVARINLAGGDLRKERREQDEILFAEEENFVIRIAAEEALEFDDRLHAGEA